MKKLKIVGSNIKMEPEKPPEGALDLSYVKIAIERGKVIGVGPDVTLNVKVGDTIIFKSWAVDIVEIGGESHYYIDEKTGGVKEIL